MCGHDEGVDRGWWDDERGGRTREEADCAGLVAYRSLDFILYKYGDMGLFWAGN